MEGCTLLWVEPRLCNPPPRPQETCELGRVPSPPLRAFVSLPQGRGLDACLQGSFQLRVIFHRTAALPRVGPCLLPAPLQRAGSQLTERSMGLRPACTSQQERLLPHIPAGQSKYCSQEGGGLQLRGANPVILPMREPGSRVTQPWPWAWTRFSCFHRHYKGWRFCSACVFQLFFSFLFFPVGMGDGQAIFGASPVKQMLTPAILEPLESSLKPGACPGDPGGSGLRGAFRN